MTDSEKRIFVEKENVFQYVRTANVQSLAHRLVSILPVFFSFRLSSSQLAFSLFSFLVLFHLLLFSFLFFSSVFAFSIFSLLFLLPFIFPVNQLLIICFLLISEIFFEISGFYDFQKYFVMVYEAAFSEFFGSRIFHCRKYRLRNLP